MILETIYHFVIAFNFLLFSFIAKQLTAYWLSLGWQQSQENVSIRDKRYFDKSSRRIFSIVELFDKKFRQRKHQNQLSWKNHRDNFLGWFLYVLICKLFRASCVTYDRKPTECTFCQSQFKFYIVMHSNV